MAPREGHMGPAPQATQGARHFTLLRSFHLADFFTLANGSCGTAGIGRMTD